jgi:predicted glycosyltransferase
MNILFDINHPVDVNFFKNAMLMLKGKGHNIHIIFRERGKLEKILRYELDQFPITMIGSHKSGFAKKISSQLHRDYKIISFIKKNKIDLIACFGPTAAISSWYCSKPYLAFDDDFEYKIPFYHANWFSTRHIYPDFIEFSNSRTFKYHGFKELAYLHHDYLNIKKNVLTEYSLLEDEYVFIREIASISLNYKDGVSILSEIVDKIKKKGLKIVLSIEDKSIFNKFKNDCIILEEPVSDIYSLMYHSLFAISSGDTVARETALLGVPTIYTGGRAMVVNEALVAAGLMFESTNVKEIIAFMDTLTIDKKKKNRENSVNLIDNKWENTTSVILKHISDFLK